MCLWRIFSRVCTPGVCAAGVCSPGVCAPRVPLEYVPLDYEHVLLEYALLEPVCAYFSCVLNLAILASQYLARLKFCDFKETGDKIKRKH